MKDVTECYKIVTSKVNFDINAGMNVDMSIPLSELIPSIVEHIDNGGSGCCLHSAIYMCKLLNDRGIYSELIATPEPTVLPDGTSRTDLRASVLYYDSKESKYYVANPIEDAEAFTRDGISSQDRLKYYDEDSGILKLKKDNVYSEDGSRILLEDYVNRYGNGVGYQFGTLFGEDKEVLSFSDIMRTVLTIDLNDIQEINDRFGIPIKPGM